LLAHKWDLPFALFTISHTGLILFYGWLVFRAASGFNGIFGDILTNKTVVYIGKISYGLYVFHMFAPSLVRYLGTQFNFADRLAGSRVLGLILDTLVTLSLAMLSWHCFEKPLNDLKRFFPYVPDRPVRPVVAANPAESQASIASNEN
jgi:peptidoglycan/LPS O-acetylase OafA/YrhL